MKSNLELLKEKLVSLPEVFQVVGPKQISVLLNDQNQQLLKGPMPWLAPLHSKWRDFKKKCTMPLNLPTMSCYFYQGSHHHLTHLPQLFILEGLRPLASWNAIHINSHTWANSVI